MTFYFSSKQLSIWLYIFMDFWFLWFMNEVSRDYSFFIVGWIIMMLSSVLFQKQARAFSEKCKAKLYANK